MDTFSKLLFLTLVVEASILVRFRLSFTGILNLFAFCCSSLELKWMPSFTVFAPFFVLTILCNMFELLSS